MAWIYGGRYHTRSHYSIDTSLIHIIPYIEPDKQIWLANLWCRGDNLDSAVEEDDNTCFVRGRRNTRSRRLSNAVYVRALSSDFGLCLGIAHANHLGPCYLETWHVSPRYYPFLLRLSMRSKHSNNWEMHWWSIETEWTSFLNDAMSCS